MAVSRREFLLIGAAAGAATAVGVIVPVGFALSDDDGGGGTPGAAVAFFPGVRVASLSGLTVGEPVFFDYPLVGQSNLLVKTGRRAMGGIGPDSDVVAFSNQCTHMGCPIETYQSELYVLGPCPCHFTTFDLAKDGQVVLGQATQSQPRVRLTLEGDDIFATGLIRLVYGYDNSLSGAEPVPA